MSLLFWGSHNNGSVVKSTCYSRSQTATQAFDVKYWSFQVQSAIKGIAVGTALQAHYMAPEECSSKQKVWFSQVRRLRASLILESFIVCYN